MATTRGGKFNPPVKHHYVPEFYTTRWCTDGRFHRLRRLNGRIVPARSCSPKAAGYEPDLYTVGIRGGSNFNGELEYMAGHDARAAKALDRLLDGTGQFDAIDERTIRHFLFVLAARNPKTLDIYRRNISQFKEHGEADAQRRGVEPAPLHDALPDDEAIIRLLSMGVVMNAEKGALPFDELPIIMIRFPSKLLITSAYPFSSWPAIDSRDALHIIALAPDVALLMTHRPLLLEFLRSAKPEDCADVLNLLTALRSDDIIGIDAPAVERWRDQLDLLNRDGVAANRLFDEAMKQLSSTSKLNRPMGWRQ